MHEIRIDKILEIFENAGVQRMSGQFVRYV
jgi:hypothetical protein